MSLFGADEHYISGQGTLGAVIKERRFIAMHRLTAVPCGHVWLLLLPINHLSDLGGLGQVPSGLSVTFRNAQVHYGTSYHPSL